MTPEDIARFWVKVAASEIDDCWEWLACVDYGGYGKFHFRINGQSQLFVATRISYFLHSGKDPGNQMVCHTCDNPACVNPKHLWLGSIGDNNRDRTCKGRQARGVKNSHTKLTEQSIIKIRSSVDTNGNLARCFGVNPQTIGKIRHNKLWTHIK